MLKHTRGNSKLRENYEGIPVNGIISNNIPRYKWARLSQIYRYNLIHSSLLVKHILNNINNFFKTSTKHLERIAASH